MTRCNCPSVPMFHRQLKLSGRNITAAAPRQQAPEPPKGHLFQQSRWTRNLNLFHHRDYFIQITMDDDCAKGSLPTPRPKCNEGGSYLEISSGQKTILDLDAIFDSEHSQLRSKQCFVRPRCPNKKLPSKHPTHLQEMEETLTEEISHDEAENFKPECSEVEEFKSAESGFRYLTIGGMRVLPVPVSGPMFWTDSK